MSTLALSIVQCANSTGPHLGIMGRDVTDYAKSERDVVFVVWADEAEEDIVTSNSSDEGVGRILASAYASAMGRIDASAMAPVMYGEARNDCGVETVNTKRYFDRMRELPVALQVFTVELVTS